MLDRFILERPFCRGGTTASLVCDNVFSGDCVAQALVFYKSFVNHCLSFWPLNYFLL
jgi:hypothetical protein